MAVEFELKFSAEPAQQEAIRQQYLPEYAQYRMQTTYYDTPGGTLSGRHITLRCRMENEEAVCTVKTPMSGYGRGEWDCRCDDILKAIPLLVQAGAPKELPELTAEGLTPVCGARFTRLAGTVDFAGAVLEIALDTGILTGGGRELPLCEVEVELKSGTPEAAIAFGMELQHCFALVPQAKSKFRRALELAQGGNMKGIDQFFDKYQRLVLFDTETTGLSFSRDEIIQFSAVVLERRNGTVETVQQYDNLVTLSPGGSVPPKIQQLTGITDLDILERGISKEQLFQDIAGLVAGNTLLLAYNAHFDLSFLYYFLLRHGDPTILKGKDKLDLLTVYRDRRPYPHKLASAIAAYGLSGKVVNSHSAIDDVIATVAVMEEMIRERNDLLNYVNLFGYLPQFGVDGKKIGSVTYKPQPYDAKAPLYEL